MTDFVVDYKNAQNPQEAFEIVKNYITPANIAKYKVKAEFDYDPSNGLITASGKGFSLTMQFSESSVDVGLDLTFLLKPLKGKLLGSIRKEVARHI
ncbi:MAG: hypothetical protein HN353_06200 [Bdellovibrionales bacterium]|jgi:hypothetical protein|nr:hypothetical protein [Bdellovibrionales bacterium]MBT3526224.1 hypothetical protein [Bdellovibrionales bacterium]MBT7668146.1 hypothetical protein [Bdellovibrionales bacterium]MBT7768298.1 hypothetical protein [Bdellovibrionales bacterium]